jgi:uncharacterized protein (UPF0332 family)
MFEDFRKTLIQPDVTVTKPSGLGKLFNKYITVSGAVEKSASQERKRSTSRDLSTNQKQQENPKTIVMERVNASPPK